MSVENLMTQVVTLRSPTGETRDEIGGSVATYSTLQTLMYLEPTTGRESSQDRNTPIGDWLGFGLADVDFTSWAQVVYGSHVFDIIAPPRLMTNPRSQVASHYELSLQEVT
jgi:hypothetical protein